MRLFFLVISLVILNSCRHLPETSQTKHDAAQYVLSPAPWLWQDISPSEFAEVYIPANNWGSEQDFFPESDFATQRMNFLLSKIHNRIKEHYPDQLRHVPVPRARIYRKDTPDAFVTTVPVCYAVPVQLGEGEAHEETSIDWVTMDLNGALSGAANSAKCIHKNMSKTEAREYFTWINQGIKRSELQNGQKKDLCQLKVQDDQSVLRIIPGATCKRASELHGITHAKGLIIWKTQPYLILYSGIIKHVDSEIKIITTLAHELGHYYRSHVNSFQGDYDYFYRIDPKMNPGQKPQRDLSLAERGASILSAARLVQSNIHKEASQRYASELFYPIWALASKACPDEMKCPKECLGLRQHLRDESVFASFGDWPYSSMPETGHASYQIYEEKLTECARSLQIEEGSSDGNAIGLSDLEMAFGDESFLKLLPSMGIKDSKVFLSKTLEQVIDQLSQGLESAKRHAEHLIDLAIQDNIGYYTTEQEADDQQMETVTLLGLDPLQLVKWDVDFYRNESKLSSRNRGLDIDRCHDLLMKNWQEYGQSVLAPIANYNDLHHSDCFRIFNTFREISAHKWDQKKYKNDIEFISDQAWKGLQNSLQLENTKELSGKIEPVPVVSRLEDAQKVSIKKLYFGLLEITIKETHSMDGGLIKSQVEAIHWLRFPLQNKTYGSCFRSPYRG